MMEVNTSSIKNDILSTFKPELQETLNKKICTFPENFNSPRYTIHVVPGILDDCSERDGI